MAESLNIPAIETFDQILGDERSGAGPHWDRWLRRFENYIAALNVADDGRKRALLLHLVGPRTFEDFQTIPNTGTTYATARTKLTNFFKPKVNVEYERIQFRIQKQLDTESTDAYHTRLRQKAATCGFDNIDREIKSQIIQTMRDSKVRRKALSTDMTLDAILLDARNNELTSLQNKEIEKQCVGARGEKPPAQVAVNQISHSKGNKKGQFQKSTSFTSSSKKCYNCGGSYPHASGQRCPAEGFMCTACGRLNHYTKFCKSTQKSNGNDDNRQNRGRRGRFRGRGRSWGRGRSYASVNELTLAQPTFYEEVGDDDQDYLFALDIANKDSKHVKRPPKFMVKLNGAAVMMIADSAATCTVVDEQTYREKLSHISLQPATECINPYSSNPLKPVGKLECELSCKNRYVSDTVFVMPGTSGCLVSLESSQLLGLLRVADHHVRKLSKLTSQQTSQVIVDRFINENPELINGIGKQSGKQYKLHIDKSVPPVVQKARRVPFHLRKKVENEINRLLDADVIERADGPTTWVSPIVVVPKPKDPENVRMCVDMKVANRAIIRERHPSPTVDDIIDHLHGCTMFSKIDLRQGYLQLELEPGESRGITTFATHMGLFRSKRLSFGITSASEIFQRAIEGTIVKVKEAMNISDDIIIGGKGQQDHDEALLKTLQSLAKEGFTINLPKCQFGVPGTRSYILWFAFLRAWCSARWF
jgi:hypothetical protein